MLREVAQRRALVRSRLHVQLDPAAWPGDGLSPINKVLTALIVLSALLAILESEPTLFEGNELLFTTLEIGFALVFLAEYAARVWVSVENPRYGPGLRGRLRYMATPNAIIDLLALTPLVLTFIGAEGYLLRMVRLLRIIRLARLGRFSDAMSTIGLAVSSRRYELAMSLGMAGAVLVVSSTLLYLLEGDVQPNTFGSIPRAMWWSIVTLTTVGYGDAFPITPLGKALAGLTALAGIGLIAMPAGILASAFSEAMAKQKADRLNREEAET